MGNKQKPDNTHEIIEKNIFALIEWEANLTVLDLSKKNITHFSEDVKLPHNLIDLNLSNNMLTEVPVIVMKLDKLKTLNLSYNNIQFFDDTPSFCHSLEYLELSYNKLKGPPYWIWTENPKNLNQLKLNFNNNLCESLDSHYMEELLQYKCKIKKIDIHNCSLRKHMRLISTFSCINVLNLGSDNYSYLTANYVETVPSIGLEDCHKIETLNLCNTYIYTIQHNIDIYQSLIEVNLSHNNINSLPNEFCNLKMLCICVLSFNKILYLPEDMNNLTKLSKLYIDNNVLCMLPEALNNMKSLRIVDLYNNNLYEGIIDIEMLEQYDFAQNYADEPNCEEYLKRKGILRQLSNNRIDGRKFVPHIHDAVIKTMISSKGVCVCPAKYEAVCPERVWCLSEHKHIRSAEVVCEESDREAEDEEEYYNTESDSREVPAVPEKSASRCSTPEDWDSDDFWVPVPLDFAGTSRRPRSQDNRSPAMMWLNYVKRKMADGNFCPMDMHLPISITDKVKYEKIWNPTPMYEVVGQFDDLSDDET